MSRTQTPGCSIQELFGSTDPRSVWWQWPQQCERSLFSCLVSQDFAHKISYSTDRGCLIWIWRNWCYMMSESRETEAPKDERSSCEWLVCPIELGFSTGNEAGGLANRGLARVRVELGIAAHSTQGSFKNFMMREKPSQAVRRRRACGRRYSKFNPQS